MSLTVEQVYETLDGFSPYPMQRRVWEEFVRERPDQQSPAFLLQAFTGSGKTEAVVFPSLVFRRRLILVLPARSLVDDLTVLDANNATGMVGRLHRYLRAWSTQDLREHTLIVDTGSRMERTVYRNGEVKRSLQHDRSHLYRADIIVTTLDKFIYRFFGFAWGRKSYIYPLRISRRDTLVCFDVAHTYEATAFTNFLNLVTTLYEKGVGVAVMTATLTDHFRKRLEFLQVQGTEGKLEWLDFTTHETEQSQLHTKQLVYIADAVENDEDKQDAREQTLQWRIERLVSLAAERWRERPRRIIVVVESVRGAVQVYKQLKAVNLENLHSQENLFLYHGRLDGKQRTFVYQRLRALDNQPTSKYVLVTTAAIEVGCDLDAELLLTEACLPDSLVQRSGRCNRRGKFNQTAEIIVVGSRLYRFARTIPEEQEQQYIALLQANSGKTLTPGLITVLLSYLDQPLLIDPRARTTFEMLYEYVYEFALENQPLYDRGFVATRSWEPSIPLVIYQDEQEKKAEINVEVSRLIGYPKESPKGVVVEEWRRGEESWDWHWTPVQKWGGSLYKKEIRVKITDPDVCGYTDELGFVDLPKVFTHASRKREGEYEVRIGYFLPDESRTDSAAGVFLDSESKKTKKRPDVFFRYLSDPELIEEESGVAEAKEEEEASTGETQEEASCDE